MTQEEFNNIDWHRGNYVRLENGKEYKVSLVKKNGRHLILKSEEYSTHFLVLYNIIVERTSDAIDTSVKEPKAQPAPRVRPKRYGEVTPVAEKTEPVVEETIVVAKETKPTVEEPKAVEEPKRKRQRVRIAAKPRYEKASLYKNKK